MLAAISIDDVKHVAELAKAAREARDDMLRKVRDEDLGEPKPARGLHNPSAFLGFDPLPQDHPVRAALRSAIEDLEPDQRHELRALVLIGQGDFGAKDLDRAVSDVSNESERASVELLMDKANLHDLLMKALYEGAHVSESG